MKNLFKYIGILLLGWGATACQNDVNPTPEVTEVLPVEALPGDLVTLKGAGLADMQRVLFGQVNARFNPVFNTDGVLMVRVPLDAKYGVQKITLLNLGGEATQRLVDFKVMQPPPVVDKFVPTEALPGEVVTITGKIFDNLQGVNFGTLPAEIVGRSATEVKVKVPAGLTDKAPITVVTDGGQTASALAFSPKGLGFFMFEDGLVNEWQNWSWAKVKLDEAGTVKSGRRSLAVTYPAWSALWFNRPNKISVAQYTTLKFWINGGKGGEKKIFVFYRDTDEAAAEKNKGVVITVKPDEWQEVILKLSDLGGAAQLKGVVFQEFGNKGDVTDPIFLDDVRLQ
ncbi:MAG: IPT/TIG domain-containing protein [Bernardetiaceae bacterium]|jgi:hypothetical protein|nr:IPT/TIG domain-containing protein [Bernardetiaceae bacterium]